MGCFQGYFVCVCECVHIHAHSQVLLVLTQAVVPSYNMGIIFLYMYIIPSSTQCAQEGLTFNCRKKKIATGVRMDIKQEFGIQSFTLKLLIQ